MEERVKELEEQVKLMSKNIVELTRIQANLIKTINNQSKLIEKISKSNDSQPLAMHTW